MPAELGGAGIFKSVRLISFVARYGRNDLARLFLPQDMQWYDSPLDPVAAAAAAGLGADRGPCGLGLPHATRKVCPLMIHPASDVLSAAFSAPTLVA